MNSRALFAAFFIAFHCLLGLAQIPKVSWGPAYAMNYYTIPSLSWADQENTFVYYVPPDKNNGDYHLQIHSSDNFTQQGNAIRLMFTPSGYKNGKSLYEGLSGDRVFVFSGHSAIDVKKEAIFLTQFDRVGGGMKGEPVLIYESESNQDLGKFSEWTYQVTIAEDSSQFLIVYPDTWKGNEAQKYTLLGVDLDGNKKWSKTISLSYADNETHFRDIVLDENGRVHMLVQIFPSEGGRKDKRFQIITYDSKSDQVKTTDLEIENKKLESVGFRLDDDNNIWLAGFYGERDLVRLSNGIVCYKLDGKTHAMLHSEIKDMDDLYPSYLQLKDQLEFYVKDMIFMENGDLVMLGEQYKYTVSGSNPPNGMGLIITDHYRNVVAVCIGPDGHIKWVQKIGKNQSCRRGSNPNCSFASFVQDGNLMLVFNDHKKNLGVIWGEDRFRHTNASENAMAVLVKIDSNGKATKTQLFQNKENGVILSTENMRRIDEKTIVFIGSRNESYKVAKMEF